MERSVSKETAASGCPLQLPEHVILTAVTRNLSGIEPVLAHSWLLTRPVEKERREGGRRFNYPVANSTFYVGGGKYA